MTRHSGDADKSTGTHCLMCLYDPLAGSIAVDGIDIDTLPSDASLRFGLRTRRPSLLAKYPAFIARVRKKLCLDQREAAEIFGGGVNAFSRYENGKTKPPLALVKLLKVLERHPDLLAEVKAA